MSWSLCGDNFVHLSMSRLQVFYESCDFPWQFAYFIAAHAVLFFILFSEFYIKAYIMPKSKKLKVRLIPLPLIIATYVSLKTLYPGGIRTRVFCS
jgi:hypothetical protein